MSNFSDNSHFLSSNESNFLGKAESLGFIEVEHFRTIVRQSETEYAASKFYQA